MIIEKIDSILLEEQSVSEKRQRSGKWSPSSFGRCYRMQYWNRLNEPKSNPLDTTVLRTFKCGKLFHDFIQGILKNDYEVETKVEIDDILGFADLVNIEEVVDIKSVRSFQFRLMKGIRVNKRGAPKLYDFRKEKKENILQVTYYAKTLNRKRGRLIFIDKDSLDVIEFEFAISEFEKELQEELDVLRKYWNDKQLPPANPRCYNGKECEYCGYQDKCLITERNSHGATTKSL